MSLKAVPATREEKALGYEFYLPSKMVYECNKNSLQPNLEGLVDLRSKGYMTQAIGPDCSYVIYKKDNIVYVVFKGTDSLKDIRDDIRMSAASMWGWLTGDDTAASFKEDVIDIAHRAIGRTNMRLPRRYTGHSLGGALALSAYNKYGRDQDICQVFSPYMDNLASKNIKRWRKLNKITVWAHKDDKVWQTGWSNYETNNLSEEDPLRNRLVWHDTSGGVLQGNIMPSHMMDNMKEYFERDIQGVAPAKVNQSGENLDEAIIFSPEELAQLDPSPLREVSAGTKLEWEDVKYLEPD
jgi:hypothetical protein